MEATVRKFDKSLFHIEKNSPGIVAEASTLGLAPGEWPLEIVLLEDGLTLHHFYRHSPMFHGPSDFCGYRYANADVTRTLTIFND